MLNIIELKTLGSKKTIWERFNPESDVWLVSDLKSKLFLTQELLTKRGIVMGEPVMRATELWCDLLQKTAPDYNSLSDVGSKLFARAFLKEYGREPWTQRPYAPEFLINATQALAPLLVHDRIAEILEEHFKEVPESRARWGETARLGAQFFRFCEKFKRLPSYFVPGWLALASDLPEVPTLWVDLGIHLTAVERELFHRLSQQTTVNVIVPVDNIKSISRKSTMSVYIPLGLGVARLSDETVVAPPSTKQERKITLGRSSNIDAEVRWATGLIREWVEKGLKPTEICITAPDIDPYLPALLKDLAWEDIGIKKARTVPWLSTQVFRVLLARLEIICGELNSDLLQEAFFHNRVFEATSQRAYLQKMIKLVQRSDQIGDIDLRILTEGLEKLRQKGPIDLGTFERIVVQIFNGVHVDLELIPETRELVRGPLVSALQTMREELSLTKLEFSDWFEALAMLLKRQEQVIHPPDPDGVHVVDIESIEEVPAKRIIVLGLTENAEKGLDLGFLTDRDLTRLAELGFEIQKSRADKLELTLHWLLSGFWESIAFSAPANDENGRPVAAHRFWIDQAMRLERRLDLLDVTEGLEWQRLQKNILRPPMATQLDQVKKWPEGWAAQLGQRVELEAKKEGAVQVPGFKLSSLSASKIEDYFGCAFTFLAKNVFSLYDDPEVDIEPSPQDRGSWLHSAVEKLLRDGKPLDQWSPQMLEALLDGTVDLKKLGDISFWPVQRRRFRRQLERFLEFEQKWREEHPNGKPAAFEEDIRGFLGWGEKPGELKWSVAHEDVADLKHHFPFRGQIDRVDLAGRSAAIIDYKNSSSRLTDIGKWAEDGSFQLALYTKAVEAGLTKLGPVRVLGAVYYALKKINRDMGFKVNEPEAIQLLNIDGKKKNILQNMEERDRLLKAVEVKIWETLERMTHGEFTPAPHDENSCLTCSWRKICRAKHLL